MNKLKLNKKLSKYFIKKRINSYAVYGLNDGFIEIKEDMQSPYISIIRYYNHSKSFIAYIRVENNKIFTDIKNNKYSYNLLNLFLVHRAFKYEN